LRRTNAVAEISRAFLQLQPAFRGLYLCHMKNPSALAAAWLQLPEVLDHRYRNAEHYEQALGRGPWQPLDGWRRSGVCWRYSFLLDDPERLLPCSEAIRQDGFHVSNLYWPVNEFFAPQDQCPNAEQFARRIVNLWVDHTVDPDWVERCAQSVRKHCSQHAS